MDLEIDWNSLITAGWTNLGIRAIRNVDATTGAVTWTYAAVLGTPEGQVVIEKPTATEAVSILDGAMTTIGASDSYDEAVLRNTIVRSENDQTQRNAQRELDAATYRAAND